MTLLTRNEVLLAKVEATIGTDSVPTATDGACNFFEINVQANIAMQERVGQGGAGRLASVPEGHAATVTFRTYLEWDGTATEPFWADVLFPACGYVKAGQVFTPRTEAPGTNVKTLTFYHFLAGRRRIITGAVGSWVATLPSGKPGYIDWTFQGVWGGETDQAMPTPAYPTVAPIRYTRGKAAFGGVNMCVSQATIDAGNTLYLRECPTTNAGYISGIITDRLPIVTVDPESVLAGTRDAYGDWLAMTERALEIDIGGPTNSVLSFDAPEAQITNVADGDRSMLAINPLTLQCNKNGATHDQELSITFTAAT